MEIYKFKRELQGVLGKNHHDYMAVEIIAEACQKMKEIGMNPYQIGMSLFPASVQAVISTEDDAANRENYLHFNQYIKRANDVNLKLAEQINQKP